MHKYFQELYKPISIISDACCVLLAWGLAYVWRFYSLLPVFKTIPDFLIYLKLSPLVVLVWFFVFNAFHLYSRHEFYRSAMREGLLILKACALAVLIFISLTFFYDEYKYSRLTILIFSAIHPIFIMIGRSIVRKVLRTSLRGLPKNQMVIMGSGQTLTMAIQLLEKRSLVLGPIWGVILVGGSEEITSSKELCKEKGIRVLKALPVDGGAVNWSEFFSEKFCDAVLIALPHTDFAFLQHHLVAIADQVSEVHIIDDIARYSKFGASVRVVNQVPILSINDTPLKGAWIIAKRTLDLLGASVAIIIFSPIMVFIALLVRFSSKGPIFYQQERMGIDGTHFNMMKFRSMPINAEAKTGAVWAKAEDNRTTPIGKVLRKTSLDELPQLFNVLRGEMSLVGPRPERPIFVEQFRKAVPGYMLRHKMKAGMTGWAQINGWRGNTSIEKRIECDLYYVQNWSLYFDLKILFLTLFRGFFGKNAY